MSSPYVEPSTRLLSATIGFMVFAGFIGGLAFLMTYGAEFLLTLP